MSLSLVLSLCFEYLVQVNWISLVNIGLKLLNFYMQDVDSANIDGGSWCRKQNLS